MEDDIRRADDRLRRPWMALRRAGPLAAVVLGIALAVAACGSGSSPGVASLNSSPSPGASSSGAPGSGNALAFSACMRSHGVKDFPDPNAQGGVQIQANGLNSDLNPNNPTFQAAQRDCGSLLPQPTAAQNAQALAQLLKFSACMRAHGIKDFPDPTNQGGGVGIRIQANGPNSDLNPTNPQFQAAQKACQSLMPGKGRGGQKLSTGGSVKQSGGSSSSGVVGGG